MLFKKVLLLPAKMRLFFKQKHLDHAKIYFVLVRTCIANVEIAFANLPDHRGNFSFDCPNIV